MKTMKLFGIAIFSMITFSIQAQQYNKEIGLRFSGYDDMDFTYFRKIDDNTYKKIRISGLYINGTFKKENSNSFNGGFDFSLSREHRVDVGRNFRFTHGWEYGLNTNIQFFGDVENVNLTPYLGYTIGLIYPVTDRLIANMDFMPRLSATANVRDGDYNATSWNTLGLTTQNIGISLRYAFGKSQK
jgi:hypothetical protein